MIWYIVRGCCALSEFDVCEVVYGENCSVGLLLLLSKFVSIGVVFGVLGEIEAELEIVLGCVLFVILMVQYLLVNK